MISLEGKSPRLVSRAQRAIAKGADTRALKRELAAGNPYAHAFLARRGLEYRDGVIVREERADTGSYGGENFGLRMLRTPGARS